MILFFLVALRELYRTKAGSTEPITMAKDIGLPVSVQEDVKIEVPQENMKIEEFLEVKDEVGDREMCGRNS
jgi:hypothetical protein